MGMIFHSLGDSRTSSTQLDLMKQNALLKKNLSDMQAMLTGMANIDADDEEEAAAENDKEATNKK